MEIIRYLRVTSTGNLYACVCLTGHRKEGSNSHQVLGAYYGYAGGGVYDAACFIIGDDHYSIIDFPVSDKNKKSKLFTSLILECSRMYEEHDGENKITEYAQSLIELGEECPEGDDLVYMDSDFDGDMLDEISHNWSINLRFTS